LTPLLDPRTLTESDHYELVHSTAGDFARLSIVRKLERYVVESAPDGLLARKELLPLTVTEKSIGGTLSDSLWGSMSAEGLDPAVILAYSDIFAWNVDFLTEPRRGDRYALSWKEQRTPDGKLADVTVLAALYIGEETGRHSATLFAGDYYENDGTSLRKAFLHAPLNFRRISSGFTNRRFHPILRQWRPHHGTDYAAAIGTPVVSIGDGMVIHRKWGGGLGNLIKIRHNGTYTTFYGHLSRYAKGLAVGQHVKQGQVIGYVGSTGFSTGPHLHFQVMKNNQLVNFLTLKMPAAGSVPASRRKAFNDKRDQVQPPLEKFLPPPSA
jgi:murein DD-endopeptidase MepM/ murein hydrolase activator NlpD